jgi:signal transduction histidine kinase
VATGEAWQSHVLPDDLPLLRDALESVAARACDVVLRTLDSEGKVRWIRLMGVPFADEQGRVRRLEGFTADLTARVEQERELERRVALRTRELLSANEDMEGFTYTVSHDLRAPLRAIAASSTILLREYGDKLDESARDELRRHSAAAKRLSTLIDDLLRLTRIGRQQMAKRHIDLTQLATRVAEELASEAARPVRVRVQEGLWAEGDENLLSLALQNLVENAIKFAKPDGAHIEVGQLDGVLFVRDHGIGFDQEFASKIFLPFERLHSAGEYPGTGIGLANVKRVVERHGGSVWAEGVPGEGSTFWIDLRP